MNFFIMMNNQLGTTIMPVVCDDEVMLFETVEEAIDTAEDHHFCKAFGYEIFERGTGTCG